MEIMNEIRTFSDALFADWSFSSSGSLSIVILLYLGASWLVSFAGAFCKVRETPLYVSLLAVGMGLLVTFLLAGICRYYLPDLAASFTAWGLLLFCSLVSFVIFSVPLLQCFWHISYPRAMLSLAGGFFLFLSVMLVIQMQMKPDVSLPARFKVPLFANPTP